MPMFLKGIKDHLTSWIQIGKAQIEWGLAGCSYSE
jgi:hypothetical protein